MVAGTRCAARFSQVGDARLKIVLEAGHRAGKFPQVVAAHAASGDRAGSVARAEALTLRQRSSGTFAPRWRRL